MATNRKTRPQTKHLSVKIHHFRSFVVDKSVTIEHVRSTEQVADMLTKPLPAKQFIEFQNKTIGGNTNFNHCEGVWKYDHGEVVTITVTYGVIIAIVTTQRHNFTFMRWRCNSYHYNIIDFACATCALTCDSFNLFSTNWMERGTKSKLVLSWFPLTFWTPS